LLSAAIAAMAACAAPAHRTPTVACLAPPKACSADRVESHESAPKQRRIDGEPDASIRSDAYLGQNHAHGFTTAQLAARPITYDTELAITVGRDSPGDGGGAVFRGEIASTQSSDGINVLGSAKGRWLRVDSSHSNINIKQIGCRDDGSNDCGQLLNTFMESWKTKYGINSELTLEVPAKAPLSYGYRLSTPIRVPDQMMVTIVGRAPPRINSFSFRTASKGQSREGAVFVVDPDVSGFSRYPDAALYPFAHLENIAFLGPGAAHTSGSCVDTWYFSERISTKNVQCYGFRYGFRFRAGGQHHGHQYPRAYGCTYGMILGDPKGAAVIEGDIYGAELHFNEYALVLQTVSSVSFYGPIIEGNQNGIVVGVKGGGHNVGNVVIENAYLERNGLDNIEAYSSGQHLYTYDGGSITNLIMRQYKSTGTGVDEARAVYAPKAAVMVFDTCVVGGPLKMGEGSTVAFLGPNAVTGGFTTIAPHLHSTLIRPHTGVATRHAPVQGPIVHSWAQEGEEAYYILKGDVTVLVPKDAAVGARVRYRFRNSPGGGLRVSLQPGILGKINNLGNGPNSQAELELHYAGGVWTAVWSGWLS
jgi:hypothetical protein